MKIRKALIPAAGFGTRFLPQTKAMPKEMMPLVDKPIIQRVVEELVEVGVETIVIVTGWNKRSIEDHFDNNFELEEKLLRAGKEKELEVVRKISNLAEFVYVRQKGPLGNATPILNAKHILGSEPFLLSWGDDFVDAQPPRAKQLINAFEKYGSMILSAVRFDSEDAWAKYGFVGGREIEKGVYKIDKIIEKPGSKTLAPSNLAVVSGAVVTSAIYAPIEKAKKTIESNQELIYTMGVQGVIDNGGDVYTIELQNAKYRDTGNKLEYLKAVVEYGLEHPEIGKEFTEYLQNGILKKEARSVD